MLDIPEELGLDQLEAEFNALYSPGPNPYDYNTPRQNDWIEKVRSRESKLTKELELEDHYYRESEAFAAWLEKVKGFKALPYRNRCIVMDD